MQEWEQATHFQHSVQCVVRSCEDGRENLATDLQESLSGGQGMLESDYSLALSINLLRIPFKYQRGPVSGVSCSELTYYQYHALWTKGFSHFPLQHSPQLSYLSFWYGSCITLYWAQLKKAWVWVYSEQPVITHHFFQRDCSLGFLEMETHV